MGPGATYIGELIPGLRSKLPDLDPPPLMEPEQGRLLLFDSITTFLKNASGTQPLVLILADLHWADRSSLLLLEFLASELEGTRLLLIGTYNSAVEQNPQHPLADIHWKSLPVSVYFSGYYCRA